MWKREKGEERIHCIGILPDCKFSEIMQCYHRLGTHFSLIYRLIYVLQIGLRYIFIIIKRSSRSRSNISNLQINDYIYSLFLKSFYARFSCFRQSRKKKIITFWLWHFPQTGGKWRKLQYFTWFPWIQWQHHILFYVFSSRIWRNQYAWTHT